MLKRIWSQDVVAISDRIAALTVAEATELSDYLEVVHGICAPSAPAMVRKVDPDIIVEQGQIEPTEFDVVLDGVEAAQRVAVIKAVRELLGLGLKEARDAVDACPKVIKERLPKADAEGLQTRLLAAGGKVSLHGRSL
jgi:large subunit ribosomal protein L7/L12